MRNTSEFSESEEQELMTDISNVLNDTGAYTALYKLLVDRHEVILHSDMENLSFDLEQYIFNWTKVDDHD
jgi:hypothetical protein